MNSLFLEIYFLNAAKLLDIRLVEERDITLLFNYLDSLHATRDKLKGQFDIDIASNPEFILLREIRNYFHHVGDVEHIHFWSAFPEAVPSALQQIVIPVSCVAKALINYRDKFNGGPEKRQRQHAKKVKKDFKRITEIHDCRPLLEHIDIMAEKPWLRCDGETVELGFDLFKCIYNITNHVADACRPYLSADVFAELPYVDETFTSANNIEKYDLLVRPGVEPILTINGYIYPTTIERAI
nr:hypothetical protein [uncultured Pseudodesulfovibrio sp.]